MTATDPVPLRGGGLATAELDVPSLPPTAAVSCRGELSDDGVLWTEAPDLALRADAPGSIRRSARVEGAWLRFVVAVDGASDGGVPFGLSVRVERDEAAA